MNNINKKGIFVVANETKEDISTVTILTKGIIEESDKMAIYEDKIKFNQIIEY
jgi:hypothetical protein